MSTNYPLTEGTLASNCYPATPQTLYAEMMAKAYVTLSITGVIISASTPAAEDQDKLWIKLNGTGFPVGRFVYQGGWVWPHEIPNSSAERKIYRGTTTALLTYDGGENAVVGDSAGPFWEVDTDFAARFPIGVGTLADSGTAIAKDATGGNDQITQSEAQVGVHAHNIAIDGSGATPDGQKLGSLYETGADTVGWQVAPDVYSFGFGETRDNQTTATAMDIINPYVGVYFIKRTARIYRTP